MTTTYNRLTAAINESIRTDSRVHCTIEANNADDVRDLCYTAWADMLAEAGDEDAELDCDVEVQWDEELEAYSVRGWIESTASEQEWLLTVETEEPTSAICEPLTVIGEWGNGVQSGQIVCRPCDTAAVRAAYEAIDDSDLSQGVLDGVIAAGGRWVIA